MSENFWAGFEKRAYDVAGERSSAVAGTSLQDTIVISPRKLLSALGAPHSQGDNYKTTIDYTFQHPKTGKVFNIYDWKATSAYHGEEGDAPSPQNYRKSDEPDRFSIGAHGPSGVKEFKAWLSKRLVGEK